MREIAVKCTLYFDLIHRKESAEEAMDRLLEILNENDIAAQIYESEIRDE